MENADHFLHLSYEIRREVTLSLESYSENSNIYPEYIQTEESSFANLWKSSNKFAFLFIVYTI